MEQKDIDTFNKMLDNLIGLLPWECRNHISDLHDALVEDLKEIFNSDIFSWNAESVAERLYNAHLSAGIEGETQANPKNITLMKIIFSVLCFHVLFVEFKMDKAYVSSFKKKFDSLAGLEDINEENVDNNIQG